MSDVSKQHSRRAEILNEFGPDPRVVADRLVELEEQLEAAERKANVGEYAYAGLRDRMETENKRLSEQLEALDSWASRMPDAGFNSDDPRWEWWHQRPRASSPASGPSMDDYPDAVPGGPVTHPANDPKARVKAAQERLRQLGKSYPDVPDPARCPNCGGSGDDMNWLEGVAVMCRRCKGTGEVSAPAKTPFQKVTDNLTNGCGCACHTGTGYRSSCEHCSPASQPESA